MRVYNKQVKFILIVLPQFMLISYILVVHGLFYVTLDDLLISDVIRGAFQGGSWNSTYTSPIFSIMMSHLYEIWPQVSWCGYTYVAIELLSMVFIDNILYYNAKSINMTLFYSITSFICWYQMWWHFTYTTVAYAAATASILYMYILVIERKVQKPLCLLPSIILFLFGTLIRREVIASVIIILGPFLVWKTLSTKLYTPLILLLFVVLMYFGVGYNAIKKTSDIEWEYTKWDSVRQDVADHHNKEDILATKVWNEYETDCFYEQIEYDRDVYNLEKAKQVQKVLNDIPLSKRLKITVDNTLFILNQYRHPKRYENTYVYLIVMLSVIAFIFDRSHVIDFLILDFGFIFTIIVFSYINRFQYRVAMPGGILAILFILCTIAPCYKNFVKYIPVIVLLLESFVMIVLHIPYRADRASQYLPQNKVAMTYQAENSDKLFLAAQTEAFGLANCVPVLEVPSYTKANLIGNWNMYSESYYSIVKSYGIYDPDHLVKSIPGSNIIRLIAKTKDGVPDYFIEFIKERSGKNNIRVDLEDTFNTIWMGEWGIYAIR